MAKAVTGGNLWQAWDSAEDGEWFETLQESPGVRIERILSRGHQSAPGDWYDQAQGEWVLLLSGGARLQIEGEPQARELVPGDWLWLPPRCRHRVCWTRTDAPTLWLAVHCLGVSGAEE